LIQVTWDMSDDNTREREINGLLEASKVTRCDKLTVITVDEESSFERNGKTIHIVPAWKWMLGGN
ncbi:MAG: ATP-binding protein, partial [Odoribacter sp.]|nr:ATP-binding protein [Odoribacter sp.]